MSAAAPATPAPPPALPWRHKIGLAIMRAAGRLPARRRIGALLGLLAWATLSRRRRVAATNLKLALPQQTAAQRNRLLRRHFIALGQWFMDNLWALSASPAAVQKYFKLEGEAPSACIILSPHFLGLELALLRLNQYLPAPAAFHYKPMHSGFWNTLTHTLRTRYGGTGFSTAAPGALRAAVRHCRAGGVLCYLPDIDPRRRKSTVFAPFMGVQQAATTTALSRLARAARVPVVPYIICQTPTGYVGKLLPPLQNFPSDDAAADAARLNQLVAEWVEKMPQNYFWLHRRFKSTPGVTYD